MKVPRMEWGTGLEPEVIDAGNRVESEKKSRPLTAMF
jgi:hypothetical protein